jgi:hypothetical protein
VKVIEVLPGGRRKLQGSGRAAVITQTLTRLSLQGAAGPLQARVGELPCELFRGAGARPAAPARPEVVSQTASPSPDSGSPDGASPA